MTVPMRRPPPPPTIDPATRLRHLFPAEAAIDGGVVRRKVRDVERVVGRRAFEADLRRRDDPAVETAGQLVVIRDGADIRFIE